MTYDGPVTISGGPISAGREVDLEVALQRASDRLIELQREDGSWCFELEADATIPAEYILWMHFTGEIDEPVEARLARYLRDTQASHGGWPLYYGGHPDVSCSVKAYYALKLAGDDPSEPHMVSARETILDLGGAFQSNVFTRITMALFEQFPWRGVPFMPVEIVLFPRWFPLHLHKISYWSRTVLVPLLILCSLRPKANNPTQRGIAELFVKPPEHEPEWFSSKSPISAFFIQLDVIGRKLEQFIPKSLRRKALDKAESWTIERLNGEHGLGAIFPAMVNAHEAFVCRGRPPDDPHRLQAQKALQNLLVLNQTSGYCQPCVSPVWDTALASAALIEAGNDTSRSAAIRALDWLAGKQLHNEPGDWRTDRPKLEGGGWPFQYQNPHYPDLDDTAMVAFAMKRSGNERYRKSIQRATRWISGMQSRNGGFGAFDADNAFQYLNEIPFADHGALLDPPTSDVSARCAMLFAAIEADQPECTPSLARCLEYLRQEQEADGAWFGRWGTNYIYGTWSVLMALEQAGESSATNPAVRRAVEWLKDKQRADGGWGESNDTYFEPERRGENDTSTPFQTAWALLGLMAAGERDDETMRRGIAYLLRVQGEDGLWHGPEYTAPGFPRVFYLKYHGYNAYFPLWALARYRRLTDGAAV